MFHDHVRVDVAAAKDAAEVSRVAAITFPLACPAAMPSADMAAFVDQHLTKDNFSRYIASEQHRVLVLREASSIVGYALIALDSPPEPRGATLDDPAISEATGTTELSKFYLLPNHHGRGHATLLMRHVLAAARAGQQRIWLGVNQQNHRAQSFYQRNGFTQAGTRDFPVGASIERDLLLARPLG
ncbi:GNAT family N-acetyltransferase [Lolliginicoccus suaedae]|uniref:GNAT family N-acetyltransferase n=1 Tax=Lolliginicoccus suaedae TaxID=2605429 RepID=UPI0016595288|nr:GNAT family N-acetyltransferase [Lolliginicoccus suaedae]